MKNTFRFEKSLFDKAFYHLCQLFLLKKLLLTAMLVSFVVAASAQQKARLLSRYDSCHVQPPEQHEQFSLQATGTAPMVRVAYVIPSNRSAQPNGVANLQHAMKIGQQFFKEQMEQNGFGPKTFIFETEGDGVTPLIHVVHVTETDEYLRGDLWNRAQTAASNAGISLWASGEVWVVIPETYLMFADGSGVGGVALGAGWGTGDLGGVSMIGSNALPLLNPAMITDDTPYDGKVITELGPYPMKQDVTFASFEGTTFSSVASSWLGALWHETGHAFGLGHDFRNDDNFHGNLMGNGLRGIRGSLFPEKYPQDYTRLEYWTALFFNVNHFFNSDKTVTNSPTVSHQIQGSVTPQQGLVQLPFQASDPDGLSFAYLVFGGDMAAEMLLEGTAANPTFAVPYFRQGDINRYTIFTVDNQGNKTNTEVEFTVPGGNNQAPFPFIKITPPVPGENQTIVLDATQSSDVDHDQSSLLVAWDVDNDGQFDTESSTNKTLQHQYQNPGNYLIRVKVTDPAGAHTVSTPVSVKIPGQPKFVCQGDVTLSSQADVDAFSCSEVTGSLTISGNDIINLNGLSSLSKLGGNITITDNPNLKTIDLPALETLGGSMITISRNGNLSGISGFNNLVSVGSIYIQDNPKLQSISGFSSLVQVQVSSTAEFVIERNNALTSLQGFETLTSTPTLRIANNAALLALDGFHSLTHVTGDLQISDNRSLKTINGLNKLTSISDLPRVVFGAGLFIENNASLESLAGLSSLRSISAHLDGGRIPPVQYPVTVTISRNIKLSTCCELKPLLNALHSGGTVPQHVAINISNNGIDCNFSDILECGQQRVNGFTLLNHQTTTIIQHFKDEITIDLADSKFSHLILQAHTVTEQVGSVEFIFDEHLRHTENKFPYEFILPALKPGIHTVRTEVYSKANKQGDKGIGRTAVLTVINSAEVISFDVVNTSGKFIKRLQEGDRININDPAFKSFSIRANTRPDHVSNVKFWLNHKFVRTENVAPYALNGNTNGSYVPWHAKPGDYTLVAIPYINADRKEYEGKSLRIHFTIEKERALAVVSFDVVNAKGQFLMRLNDGDKINTSDPRYKAFNIVANTKGRVGSVSFWLNHQYQRTENVAPYAFAGDQYGYFNTWQPAIGHYNVSAIPYSGSQANGAPGKKLSIHFRVVNERSEVARFGEGSADGQGMSVSLYPVPVANELHVKIDDLPGGDPQITIHNIHGLIVYRGCYSKSRQIDTSPLPVGLYYLQITGDMGFQKVVKFIKN